MVSMTTSDDSDDPGFQWDANDDVADEPTSGCESDLEDDQVSLGSIRTSFGYLGKGLVRNAGLVWDRTLASISFKF